MPRGLPVGVVVRGLDKSWRVQLSSDRAAIDFVRILKFEDFSQLVNMTELAAPIDPASMAGGLPPPPPKPVLALPQPAAPAATPPPAANPAPSAARPANASTTTAPSMPAVRRPAAQQPRAAAQPALRPGEYRRVVQPDAPPRATTAAAQ